MMMRWMGGVWLSLVLVGCQTGHVKTGSVERVLPADEHTIETLASSIDALETEFVALKESGEWGERGYFSAQESDRMELLMFRFHTVYQPLHQIAARKGASRIQEEARRLAFELTHFLL